MNIRGLFFFIIGVFVYFYSFFIESKASANLLIFKIISLLFIIYGVFKETIIFLSSKEKKLINNKKILRNNDLKNKNLKHNNFNNQLNDFKEHLTHHHYINKHPSYPHIKSSLIRCPHCYKIIPKESKICPYCHQKI